MKFTVTMKDPDALVDAIDSTVARDVKALGLDADETKVLLRFRYEKALESAKKWFRNGEYVRVEIDTEAGTRVVLEV